MHELPRSTNLSISNLSRVFGNTTNSYKYVFFLSVLDVLKRRGFDAGEAITFRELIIEMLANAWFPHTYFKLSFGIQDKIADQLDALNLEVSEAVLKFTDTDKQQLRQIISEQKIDSSLMRYVPFRFLRPFVAEIIQGSKDAQINSIVRDSASHYDAVDIPYIFDGASIKVHQQWANYFKEHYAIVRAWVAWEWLEYMQKCNPNVPAVSQKLFPPQERASLADQKKYWRVVIENVEIKCIFSKQRITEKFPPLDHYLPWSFVAHDQLWNLIPILQSVNSAKSNNLPDSTYHRDFIALQHLSLTTSHAHLSDKDWNKHTDCYMLDLKIMNRKDLLNIEILENAYQPVLSSLNALAKGQGFTSGWVYTFSEEAR
jgi:hypothetical protein